MDLEEDIELTFENTFRTQFDSLNEQRLIGQYCDVTLRSVDGVEFQAHKNCLAAGSDYFAKMLNCSLKESKAQLIEMKGFDGEVLETILQYIYTGTIKINFNNVLRVLQAFDLMLVDKVVDEIDAKLSVIAVECTEEVLETVTSFDRLPRSRKSVACQICVMDDKKKRVQCLEKVNVEMMCEIVKTGGPKFNEIFPDILPWFTKNKSDMLLLCENLDFTSLSKTNLRKLVDFSLNELKDKSLGFIFKKTVNLFFASRSGIIRLTVKNLSQMSPQVFSDLVTIGGLRWKVSAAGNGDKEERDGQTFYKSLGIFLYCIEEDNRHVKKWNCAVTCTLKLFSSTGIALERVLNASYTQNTPGWGFKDFITWESLVDSKHGYVTDDSISIEAHLVIESLDIEFV